MLAMPVAPMMPLVSGNEGKIGSDATSDDRPRVDKPDPRDGG